MEDVLKISVSKLPAIVFLNFDGTEGSVFWSQIVEPMRAFRDIAGCPVHMIILNRFDMFLSKKRRQKADEAARRCGFPAVVVPRYHYLSNWLLYLNLIFVYPSLRRLAHEKLIIHARGPFAAFLAIGLRRLCPWLPIDRVLYDCRGDILAEYEEYRGRTSPWKRFRLWQLRRLEKHVLAKVDHVNVVSGPLRDILQTRYGYKGECTITPSAINVQNIRGKLKDRKTTRVKLGINDKLVVLYSGSMIAWQLPEELVMIFRNFQAADKNSFFLVLTSTPEGIHPLLRKAGIAEEDYRILSAGPDELPSLMACGDVGLLLREPNGTNRVASPTKFAEYMGCGVPVLMTRGIGDLDALVKEQGVGWGLDTLHDPDHIRRTVQTIVNQVRGTGAGMNRLHIQETAERHFSMQSHVNRLRVSYGMGQGIKDQ